MTNELAIAITLMITGIIVIALLMIAHLWIWDEKKDDDKKDLD